MSSATIPSQLVSHFCNVFDGRGLRYQKLSMHWSVLNEDQTKSTVFCALPSDSNLKVHSSSLSDVSGADGPLLNHEQSAAVAEVCDQVGLQHFEILFAIHRMDLSIMSAEQVEKIVSIAPSEVDAQRLKDYRTAHPEITLSENEQFLMELSNLDQLDDKLAVMLHIGKFEKQLQYINNRLNDLQTAARNLLDSESFKMILQLVLSLENQLVGMGEGQSIKGFIVSKMIRICSFVLPSGQSLIEVLASYIKEKSEDLKSVFELIPTLQLAAKISYQDVIWSLSKLEEGNGRAERVLKENNNMDVSQFMEFSRTHVMEVADYAFTVKDELQELLSFMAEPLPHSHQSFEPELFFKKVADFLELLRNIVQEQDK